MSDFASEIPNARKIRGKVVENGTGTHVNSLPYKNLHHFLLIRNSVENLLSFAALLLEHPAGAGISSPLSFGLSRPPPLSLREDIT